MSKRILVTSTDLMMIQFLVPHVIFLSQNGYEVDIACSDVGGRMREVQEALEKTVKGIFVVRLERSPVSVKNLQGYKDMKSVISGKHYDIIWTNEPVMGVVTRLAAKRARKRGTKVLYMTHGFHFFDGAPIQNWIIYYPVEKFMSRFTDLIVTINHEDYERAKKFHVKEVKYIHGIGVNTNRYQNAGITTDIRRELKLPDNSFLLLSVGELHPRKNQEVVIRALAILRDMEAKYIICGKGNLLDKYRKLAEKYGVLDQIYFLGYRKDVLDIYGQVDLFVFPSRREGLGLAGLEAMHYGLPMVTSNTRGPRDYMENGKTGYMCSPEDANAFAKAIKTLKQNEQLREKCGRYNKEGVKPFLLENVKQEVLNLVKEILE